MYLNLLFEKAEVFNVFKDFKREVERQIVKITKIDKFVKRR